MKAKTPSPDDLRLAALWCENNEGDENERGPMQRVARWLEAQADAIEERQMAAECGVTVKALRNAVAKQARAKAQ